MPEIGASGSASGDGKRPLPHGLILDAGSMTFGGAGEGNRTLVISWKAVALPFRPRSFHSTKSLFLQVLTGRCTVVNGQEIFTPIHGVALPRRHPGGAAVVPTKSLTELFVARVKPPAQGRVEYFDAAFPGLALRVTANGSKSWCTFYRFKGRLRRFTIGAYPAIKPAQARREAAAALDRARGGIDPAVEKPRCDRGDRQHCKACRGASQSHARAAPRAV